MIIRNILLSRCRSARLAFAAVFASLVLAASAGDIVPVSMQLLPMDMTGPTSSVVDAFGRRCALIKVMLPYKGAEFGGVIKTEAHPGVYYVWVEDGNKMMEVRFPDCLPKMIIFGDYMEQARIQAPRTYELRFDLPALGYTPQSNNASDLTASIPDNLLHLYESDAAEDLYELGQRYYNGSGVKQDFEEAAKWYREAAEKGHAIAQYNLGNMYFVGEGVPKDMAAGIKWWSKAAEQSYDEAQFYLGVAYDMGKGVQQDYNEAMRWLLKAAESGHLKAQLFVGARYYEGKGVKQDFAEAAKWWRKAAEAGYADTQFFLGLLYENGLGVKKNVSEAVNWYRKASAQGYSAATDALTRLGK